MSEGRRAAGLKVVRRPTELCKEQLTVTASTEGEAADWEMLSVDENSGGLLLSRGQRLLKGNLTVIFLVLLTKRAVAVMVNMRVFHTTGSVSYKTLRINGGTHAFGWISPGHSPFHITKKGEKGIGNWTLKVVLILQLHLETMVYDPSHKTSPGCYCLVRYYRGLALRNWLSNLAQLTSPRKPPSWHLVWETCIVLHEVYLDLSVALVWHQMS